MKQFVTHYMHDYLQDLGIKWLSIQFNFKIILLF